MAIQLTINDLKEAVVDLIKKKTGHVINVNDVTFFTEYGIENPPLNNVGCFVQMPPQRPLTEKEIEFGRNLANDIDKE
jgi:hypothetical protein